MLTLILGPNGSGKSRYAETLAASFEAKTRYYIATMVPYGEEGMARVNRHIAQREGLGFTTIERRTEVSLLAVGPEDTVLLEDVSNLAANSLFEKGQDAEAVVSDIVSLEKKCRNLIAVSISGIHDADGAGEQTKGYIRMLNAVNTALVALAGCVVELNDGIPTIRKGALPCAQYRL